jgi:hypothetical protein
MAVFLLCLGTNLSKRYKNKLHPTTYPVTYPNPKIKILTPKLNPILSKHPCTP